MHADLANIGWTEEHWNRIVTTVTEEAQKARVAAQVLPMVGPEEPSTVAVPTFQLFPQRNPQPAGAPWRQEVDSNPSLSLTTIAINVPLHLREAADPDLTAALVKFRRAANYVARIEDAVVFNGRPPLLPPPFGLGAIPNVYQVYGPGGAAGIFPFLNPPGGRAIVPVPMAAGFVGGAWVPALGDRVVTAIIQAINQLDGQGQIGPYACALSPYLFEAICTPNPNLVLPRDRILPFLQGPLVRSSAIFEQVRPLPIMAYGLVVALSANPVEIVVASELSVRFLQTTEEPRLVFRVSERVALRIKETAAIAILTY